MKYREKVERVIVLSPLVMMLSAVFLSTVKLDAYHDSLCTVLGINKF